jgi:glycosyltransferase involved in cell wall biosynthesis
MSGPVVSHSQAAPLRIAFTIRELPFGGTTTFCLFLGAALRERGVDVRVFSFFAHNPLGQEFEQAGIPLHLADGAHDIYEDRLTGIYAALRAFKPQAVFAVMGAESFEVLRYLPSGVLRAGMVHDHTEEVYQTVARYLSWMDQITVDCSPCLAETRQRFPGKPSTNLQLGVRLLSGRRLRTANPDAPLRLLYFGRLQESQKRVRLFPAIWRELKRRGLRFQWTIHGEGPEKPWLTEQLAEPLATGEVVFSPPVKHDALPDIIRAHDVFLLTSAHEGGPQTLLEAMGYGLVPVCSDIPCLVQDLVRPDTGFRVAVGDVAAYGDAVEQLDQDRRQLEVMSTAALRAVETDFTDQALGDRYLTWLRERLPSTASPEWPARIEPQAVLDFGSPLRFAAFTRPARRLWKRLRR